jgi:hypothetical protein
MKATWEIDCDQQMLEMLAFSVGVMRDMLKENLDGGDKLAKKDIKTADKILAAIYKGQVNLEVAIAVKKKTDTRLKRSRPTQGDSRRGRTKK